jgi:hypothetical protein
MIVLPTIRHIRISYNVAKADRITTTPDFRLREVKGLINRCINRCHQQQVEPSLHLVVIDLDNREDAEYYHIQMVIMDNVLGERITVPIVTLIPEELAQELEPSLRFNCGFGLWGSTFYEDI